MANDDRLFSFSVLISVYQGNTADELREAVDSILNQTLKPPQIVLVADGQLTLALDRLLEQYSKDLRFRIIRLPVNQGLGKALQAGLAQCDGEYVARMDADDYSLPERFEKQVAYLKQHPETDVLGGQIVEFDGLTKKAVAKREVPGEHKEIAQTMALRNGINHVSVFFRKASVVAAGGYQEFPFFEDYHLWCRMLKNGCLFHNLSDTLVLVRTNKGMYKRRGGLEYSRAMAMFERELLRLGITNRVGYCRNIMIRFAVAFMPNALRLFLYRHFLRTGFNEADPR